MLEAISSAPVVAFFVLIGSGLVVGGRGFMIFLKYLDAKAAVYIKAEQASHSALKAEFRNRIEALEGEVKRLQRSESLHLRRIYHLEAYINELGIKVPLMDGWPPNDD